MPGQKKPAAAAFSVYGKSIAKNAFDDNSMKKCDKYVKLSKN